MDLVRSLLGDRRRRSYWLIASPVFALGLTNDLSQACHQMPVARVRPLATYRCPSRYAPAPRSRFSSLHDGVRCRGTYPEAPGPTRAQRHGRVGAFDSTSRDTPALSTPKCQTVRGSYRPPSQLAAIPKSRSKDGAARGPLPEQSPLPEPFSPPPLGFFVAASTRPVRSIHPKNTYNTFKSGVDQWLVEHDGQLRDEPEPDSGRGATKSRPAIGHLDFARHHFEATH